MKLRKPQKEEYKRVDAKVEKQWVKEAKRNVDPSKVDEAFLALLQLHQQKVDSAKTEEGKQTLFKEEENVDFDVDFDENPIEKSINRLFSLVFRFKSISPEKSHNLKSKKVSLPNPFVKLNKNLRVCFITFGKPRILNHISSSSSDFPYISKILTIDKIKKRYKTFLERRQLSYEFDVFLVEFNAIHLIPQLLGKKFLTGAKRVVAVNMPGKEQIQVAETDKRTLEIEPVIRSALECTQFVCSGLLMHVKVGRLGQEAKEVVQNSIQVIAHVANRLPYTSWDNIDSISLRLGNGMLLEVFQSPLSEPLSDSE